MDKLGRKFFLVVGTVSAGICSAVMYFVSNKIENLIVSATFSAVISCANAALDCLITEVFPTNLRATGVAVSMVSARLGGIIGNGNLLLCAKANFSCQLDLFTIYLNNFLVDNKRSQKSFSIILIIFLNFSCDRNIA